MAGQVTRFDAPVPKARNQQQKGKRRDAQFMLSQKKKCIRKSTAVRRHSHPLVEDLIAGIAWGDSTIEEAPRFLRFGDKIPPPYAGGSV
jgi:hypothetical protein